MSAALARATMVATVLALLLVACGGNKRADLASQVEDSTTAVTHSRNTPLTVLPGHQAVCRLNSGDQVPAWATASTSGMSSITRTADELSIIVADSLAPPAVRCERGWRMIKVRGPLPLNLVGIVAGLSGTLADAGVSLFALSTYDTDYIMVKQVDLNRATKALRQAGYPIRDSLR